MASGDSRGPVDLKDREIVAPSADALREQFGGDFSDAERERLEDLNRDLAQNDSGQDEAFELGTATGSNDSGQKDANWKINVGNGQKVSLGSRMKSAKSLWLGGAGVMAIVSLIFAVFMLIAPYKAESIIRSIESRVGEIPQNAVEHRLEFYMARYLMLRAAETTDTSFEKNRAYTYIGNGVFRTLYTNWKGAKLEAILESEYKMRVRPAQPVGQLLGRQLVQPTNWVIEYLDEDGNVTRSKRISTDEEMRKEFRDFSKNETNSPQVLKRYHMRKVLKRYYGVRNWKPFEKTQRIIEDKYLERKLVFQKFMVKQTVGRMSSKHGAYLTCLLEGGEKCKQENLSPPDETPGDIDPEMEKALDDSGKTESSNALTKKLQEIGMKRVIASVAGGVSIGLTVLELMDSLQSSAETGALSRVTYDSISQQTIGFSTAIQSASDQIRSGEDFEPEDPRVLVETFNGFEASPVYRSGFEKGVQYVRDCDDDGVDETTLPTDETVCPNKKVIQNRETIKNMFFWPVVETLGSFYRNSGLKGASDWFGSVMNGIFDTLGINALYQKIAEATGLAAQAAKYIGMAIQWVVGFNLTGLEVGPDAYDATYAGIEGRNSALGSTLGGSREGTIGGAPLTDEQVAAIMQEDKAHVQYALSKKGFFERYFSPDVESSITSYAIMHTPTNFTSLSGAFLAAINPSTLLSRLGTLFSMPVHAADTAAVRSPFGFIRMGYTNNDPVLTMEEEDLNATYRCDLPEAERPQNKKMGRPQGVPFDIYTQTDPCLLDKAVEAAGSKYFDGGFNDLDD